MDKSKEVLAVKAGIWYTISNFLIRSISIISTPIFTRLMSLSEYGEYNNFTSWLAIITILATFDLHSTLNRARFDFRDDIDGYISSITFTSLIIPSILYAIAAIFSDFFCSILSMDKYCLHCMFLSIIFSSAINIFQAKQRVFYRYKESVILTFVSTVITIGSSLILVILFDNKLYGRVFGQTIPAMIINICLAIYLIRKGHCLKFQYIKYAILICLPYIPHLLAMNILSQYDRIQIKQFCGAEDVAYYSLAYSCALVVNIFLNSLNNAWSPWMGDMLNQKRYGTIRKKSKKYIALFVSIAIGIFLVAPELLFIFGGSNYSSAIYVMPPVIAGSVFQFIYTLYVNVEIFEKKVWGVAAATSVAAIVNVTLNAVFIPIYGYIAAAYTTLFCYGLLCFLHYLLVRRLGLHIIYHTKFIIIILFSVLLFALFMYPVYRWLPVRIVLIVLYVGAVIAILFKNRKRLINILRRS